jgi:RNA polymerase-binding transcription factor DksA
VGDAAVKGRGAPASTVRAERDRGAAARRAAAGDVEVLPPPASSPDLDVHPGDRADRLGPGADVEVEERRERPPPPRWTRAEEERYRGKLLDARDAVRKNLEELREELRGLQVPSHELEEWAQEEKERDILILQEQRQEEELSRIQIALGRLDAGTYGQCARCGRRISKERLDEIPAAVFCRNCQP